MTTTLFTHTDYTTLGTPYQLSLPLNIEFEIPPKDPVRLVRFFTERMDLSALYRTYSHREKNQASPRQLLAIVVYAAMNGIFSSRKMEEACRRDLNFMYLLEGKHASDLATIARFRSLHLAACSKEVLARMTDLLAELGALSGKFLFIDGTKIESAANKYTFVWKKSVTKYQAKLLQKIPAFIARTEEAFGLRIVHQTAVHRYHLRRLYKKLKQLQEQEHLVFVHGRGKRKTPLQRAIERTAYYLEKTKEYANKLHTCGTRNSYAKTDTDATFMRMKEDAMKNGQLKPAYNIQYGVDSEFVVWAAAGPQTTDTPMLIPFLTDMERYVRQPYTTLVADAGYESEENYAWLAAHGRNAYIKPTNYKQKKTKRYKTDISRWETMTYDEETDTFRCTQGRILSVSSMRNYRTATGYTVCRTQYTCEDCSDCPVKAQCIRSRSTKPLEERTKGIELSKPFQQYRRESQERITTPLGIQLRVVNRSIQAEGVFSRIKDNLSFRRFFSKGQANILTESMVLAMAHNIGKLHYKLQAGRLGQFLFPVSKTA
ncbi:IS1182 family transposase [uncultured Megasphaera sp.]|uniref:IS1182 family transposase n=1 Tax=uncultured Megasphaera sp. TaxID=165188 RepID=UPI00265D502C|nr:IS1182 family transposase [uncultured Megasphaera sp.]